MPPLHTVHAEVLVLGGGVAGLWTLAALRRAGRSALLVEPAALGTGQTIASQGIIHGGLKYALTGTASAAARAIAAMPARWAAALAGEDRAGPDLRGAAVLSPHYHLFTTGSIGSRLVALAASKVIRTPVAGVPREDRPPGLREGPRGLDVYRVAEPVLDPASLVAALAADARGSIVAGSPTVADDGSIEVRLGPPAGAQESAQSVRVLAGAVVLTAGAGNSRLLAELAPGVAAPRSQLRPLRMAMLRSPSAAPDRLPLLHAHAVAASLSDKPRLTITSQRDSRGRSVWYIGGLLAEPGPPSGPGGGVLPDPAALHRSLRAELAACLPWIDARGCETASFVVQRAEGITPGGDRPDEPVVERVEPREPGGPVIIAAWPTKLAFAPLVADRVLSLLPPRGDWAGAGAWPAWPAPAVAALPWESGELRWTALESDL